MKSDRKAPSPEPGHSWTRKSGRHLKRGGRRRWLRWVGFTLLGLLLLAGVARAALPRIVRNYVNRTLDRSPLYQGTIGQVKIHLWRGAYSISDVRVSKRTGSLPDPFFFAKRADFAIQWNALWHGRVVGRLFLDEPQINFVDARDEGEVQTGAGGPWLQMIRDLSPFQINRALVRKGSIHLRTYRGDQRVDVYLSELDGSLDNLGNIREETTPLVATVQARGLAMDQARFEYKMTLDPFSYHPTFHLAMRLVGLDVTKINDFAMTYGKFDFKRGWFDFVLEVDSKEGEITGYAKPLFRNLQVFSLAQDIKQGNPIHFFWQALVGGASKVLRNPPRDQFGTLIPFSGNISDVTTVDILATIGNVLRNAFIRAYLPRLEGGETPTGPIQFQAPEFTESLAAGDSS